MLKDSVGRLANVPSIVGTADERFRKKLIDGGVMRADGETVVFEKDHLFGSPTMAAVALTGTNTNGWFYWRNKEGETLDALKRQSVGDAS